MGNFTLGKYERLKKETVLNTLFNKGKAISWNGFTLVYLFTEIPSTFPAQAGFSVPKRIFKNAHDRNKIKRRMREVYRKNKAILYNHLSEKNNQLALMLIYKGKKIASYNEVETALLRIFEMWVQKNQ